MKRAWMVSLCLCLVTVGWGEDAPPQVLELANTVVAALGEEPAIVAAVQAANAQGRTLEEIQAQDKQWVETAGVADFMQALMDNACARRLKEFQKEHAWCSEAFVMDNQGVNVGMTDKTSDYWQGDEEKFTAAFNSGNGGVFVDKVKFDDSVQTYTVQVSVPVKDGGKAIEALTIGIDIDKL